MKPAAARILAYRSNPQALKRNLGLLVATLLLVVLSTCSPHKDVLTQIRAQGVLKVATINSPTTYYFGAKGALGYDYDLAQGFADHLGVKLDMIVAQSPQEAIEMVEDGRANMAAAGLAVSPAREQRVRFSQSLLTVKPQLVYRMGDPRPSSLADLHGKLTVVSDSVHAERLESLKKQYPNLSWDETDDQETEQLLYEVANGQLQYTIANSDIIAINQRYYPRLRVAFDLADAQDLAWALPRDGDDSLFGAVQTYIAGISGKTLARLRDRYFGHVERINYFGAVTLASQVQSRLPKYRAAFMAAGKKYGVDWRLLAAMGYQESQWDPEAVSPTGVKGLMMLTLDTANFLNVQDREDPTQSIFGGALYYTQILDQLPDSIKDPDRAWMALAAYNIGLGHLLDARVLTREVGGNPNHWLDVRNSLPLLTQARWYSRTRHGYARGYETVTYVGNVRTFYDMLTWITNGAPAKAKPELAEPPLQTPQLPKGSENPLHITTPIL
ncbi:MAG: membrane-bound lytic murein transglycosylase MltF [Stenotrophobium sp.]